MAVTEHSEHVKDDVAALGQAVKQSLTMPNGSSEDSQKSAQPSPDLADDAEIQHVQEQLRALNARADAMEAEATKLAQESSGSAATEAEQARNQAAAMRGAATQAQSAIAAAPTDTRTGKKRISAAKLSGISSLLEHIITEAEQETRELGTAIVEVRTNNAKRATARSTTAKPNVATRLAGALTGSSAASHAVAARVDDDDEKEFLPAMNGKEARNHDGTVSGREAVVGAAGLVRALGSKKKRATAGRIIDEVSDAAKKGDQRGMLDGALHAGRGVARVTGSDDLGHVATVVVGTSVTKTTTATKLASELDGWGLLNAAGRNISAVFEAGTDVMGLNTLANQVRPHLGSLMADKGIDFEKLVNAKGVKQFDTDGNGRIDASEVLQVLRNNGVTFGKIDDNHDGKISYAELRSELYAIALKNHARVEGRVISQAPAGGHIPSPTPQRPRAAARAQQD